jgi:hypothetical protein
MTEDLYNPPITVEHTAIDVPQEELEAEEMARLEAEMRLRAEEEEKRIVRKLHARFRRSQVERQPKEKLWTVLDTFDRGEQWKDANIPPWVPKPVLNFIRHYRTLKRANLASAISRPTFEAIDPEDQPIIDQLQKAHDHVWHTEKVPRTIRRCIDRALLLGTSIAMVYTDETYIGGKYYPPEPLTDPMGQPVIGPDGSPVLQPSKKSRLYQGKICVKRIPIENFFGDPDAYRLEDMKWCEITEIVPFSTIKNNPQFQQYAGDKLAKLKAPRPDSEAEASGEIFKRDYKITEGSGPEEGDEVVTLHTHFQRYVNEQGRWQMDVIYYLQGADFILYRLDDVQPNELPFAVYYDEEEEKDFYGTSLPIAGMLEQQKIVNKVQQVSAVIGALHQNPQKIVLRESGINAQKLARAGNVPGQVWESNVPNPIEIIQPPDIPRGLFELDDRTKADMRDQAGLNEAYMGQSVGSLTTSTGVESLIERATIRDRDKMIQIDEFVERISHLIVLNIIHKWQEERPIAVPQPDGTSQFDQWRPIDPLTAENLEWRVKSNIYAKAPITQATRRQQADKLLQLQGQFQFQPAVITPEEWIKFQEFDDAPAILQRMQADRLRLQQQQQMAASGMIQQGLLQAAQMLMQGAPPEQVQPLIDQLVQIASQPALAMGQPPGEGQQQPSAPGQPQLPQGATSQVAMANMASGGM